MTSRGKKTGYAGIDCSGKKSKQKYIVKQSNAYLISLISLSDSSLYLLFSIDPETTSIMRRRSLQ